MWTKETVSIYALALVPWSYYIYKKNGAIQRARNTVAVGGLAASILINEMFAESLLQMSVAYGVAISTMIYAFVGYMRRYRSSTQPEKNLGKKQRNIHIVGILIISLVYFAVDYFLNFE